MCLLECFRCRYDLRTERLCAILVSTEVKGEFGFESISMLCGSDKRSGGSLEESAINKDF